MRLCSLILLLLLLPLSALAKTCADRARVLSALGNRYGEARIATEVREAGLIEVYGSAERGSWTMIVTDESGRTCVIASGQGYSGGPPQVSASQISLLPVRDSKT